MKTLLIIITLTVAPTMALADDLAVQVHIGSEHWIEAHEQKEDNPGAGFAYDRDNGFTAIAGGYHNTEGDDTWYLAVGGHMEGWGGRHRFMLGGATGYDGHSVYPMFGWQFTTHGLLGTLLPGAVGYGAEKRLLSW